MVALNDDNPEPAGETVGEVTTNKGTWFAQGNVWMYGWPGPIYQLPEVTIRLTDVDLDCWDGNPEGRVRRFCREWLPLILSLVAVGLAGWSAWLSHR